MCRSRSRRRSSRPCCRRSTASGRRAVSSSSTETLVDVTMPQMGVSVAEGTIVEWRKAVGDRVERDEIICSISTDKIDTDVESPASGTVVEILVQPDETVDVGTVMARIDTGGGDAPAPAPAPAAPSAPAPAPAPGQRGNGARPRRYSPVVQRIAAE